MQSRTLILGRMPSPAEGAAPETHLAAGPWCFVGREDFFPDWEQAYTFAPDPFDAPEALEQAARQAQSLAARCIPLLARELRPASLPPLPAAYWDTALGAWMIMATQQLVGYAHRARLLAERWGGERLRVPLLPDHCPFFFATEQAYLMGGILGHAYVHWLLSRLLEVRWPAAWEKVMLPLPDARDLRHEAPPPSSGKARIKAVLRNLVDGVLLGLPFPRVKGFSLVQSVKFSWALLRNRNGEDRSQAMALPAADTTAIEDLLLLDPMPAVRLSMPQTLRAARHPRRLLPAARKRTRVAGIAAFEDTEYRLRLARWRGSGHKLVHIQHGGNYGNVRVAAMDPMMEYAGQAFITWGWSRQSPYTESARFVPLPHGQLARLRGAHEERSGALLLVGTEISAFPYRMDSRPTPLQYVRYRDGKRRFFAALPSAIRRRALYRPYFNLPGTLEDASWLLPRFPDVRLCVGPLEPHMLACRLLVLDHHGTTLEQAMAARVPTVAFWDREAWGLCPETETLLDELAAAGVWHPTAEAAAAHAARIWDDAAAWWESGPVRTARERWSASYARTVEGDIDPLWMQALKTI